MPRVQSFKDLGVTFDHQLKFDQHISSILKKAFSMLGFIIRTSRHFSHIESIILLYKTLVRSNLEYASIIWNPSTKTQVDALEKVQRKLTRFIYRKFHYPYQDYETRLKTLNLQSLHVRRCSIDLKYLYKIVNGLLSTTTISEMPMRLNMKNVRNMQLFGVKKYNTNLVKNSTVPRLLNTYNDLFSGCNLFNLPISEFMKIVNQSIK